MTKTSTLEGAGMDLGNRSLRRTTDVSVGSFFTLAPRSARLPWVRCSFDSSRHRGRALVPKAALGGQLSAPPLRRRLRTVPNTQDSSTLANCRHMSRAVGTTETR
jgi:hypothetical protein